MPWIVQYNDALRIVELVLTGDVSGSDLREATSRIIALSKELGVLDILIDATDQQRTGSYTDLFHLADSQYAAEKASLQSRAALVVPQTPELSMAAQFYETVCQNRGWLVQSCANREEAIAWLKDRAAKDRPETDSGA
jgi:hypothetical protein